MADPAFVFTTRAAALLLWVRCNNATNSPRCNCPTHLGAGVVIWHPRMPPCTCTGSTGAGVDNNCPHITRRWARVWKHPTLALWAVRRDPTTFANATAPERALETDLESDGAWASAGTDD